MVRFRYLFFSPLISDDYYNFQLREVQMDVWQPCCDIKIILLSRAIGPISSGKVLCELYGRVSCLMVSHSY